jgi:hypothetical protein
MKYTIHVNQAGADAANLRGKVDIIDLAIFDAFKDFANGTKCEKKIGPDGRVWFWVSYSLIIAEIPYCGIKTNDGIYRRMKNLQAVGVIEFHPENQRTNKTFFTWGDTYDLLISDSDLRMKNRTPTDEKPEGYGLKTGRGTDEKPDNHYTIDKSTKTKEEEKEKFSSTAEAFALEAEKQKPIPPVAPAPLSIELHDPETPGVTIYDHIPHKGYPTTEPVGEWQRVNVPQEIEALKTDTVMRLTFTMSRKIPSANYTEYLDAFLIDVQGRGETYTTAKQLKSHFLNWSGRRFEIQCREAKESKPATPTGQPAKIRQL